MDKTQTNHLQELTHSEYKIAKEHPTINNWRTVDNTGKFIGKVKDLLFDKEALKVRYVIINLKNGELLNEDRDVIIPIGKIFINKLTQRVVLPGIHKHHLSSLPHYLDVGSLTQEDEVKIRTVLNTQTVPPVEKYDKTTFYKNKDFKSDLHHNIGLSEDTGE